MWRPLFVVMIHLNPREKQIICAMCVQDLNTGKHMAFALHIPEGSFKIYVSRLYRKLGWASGSGSHRMLALWGIAHRAELAIALPEILEETGPAVPHSRAPLWRPISIT